MSGPLTELLVLGLTLALSAVVYRYMRAKITLVPGRLTKLFGWVMSAHALVNLVARNLSDARIGWDAIIVTNLGCCIFLATYLNLLRRHEAGPLFLAIALALGSFAAFVLLMALGRVPLSIRFTAYTTMFAGFALFVAWRSSVSRARR
jgi:hypothetical protein